MPEVLERLLDSLGRAMRFDEASVLIRTRDGMDVIVSRGPRGPCLQQVRRGLQQLCGEQASAQAPPQTEAGALGERQVSLEDVTSLTSLLPGEPGTSLP